MEHDPGETIDVDPDSSPFEGYEIDPGLPYKKGSAEDLAIRRVIEEAERRHASKREG